MDKPIKDWNDAHKAGYSAKDAADEAARADNQHTDASPLIVSRVFADIPQTPVEWIKEGFLAVGKLTLLGGNPGMGKSQIAAYSAARPTTGTPWWDGTRSPVGSVVFFSAEDSADDTIGPRLDFAGANRRLCIEAQSVRRSDTTKSFTLKADLDALGRLVSQHQSVRCINFDPITAYMGDGVDSHRTTDVRAVLEPLARFAEQYRLAILAITHPPKGAQTSAINAFTGSLAYVAAARLAFLATQEPETERRLLLPVKNNLGPKPSGLGYSIEGGLSSAGVRTSRIQFDNMPVTITADEAMAATTKSGDRGAPKREAIEFLEEQLADGPKLATAMETMAEDRGIAARTLKRARKELGIQASKDGFQGEWVWALP